ncbi:MAG: hypothetical protein JSV80_09295 [Acidobacteriota bacterium]|nr:MAG: hypothetical protein JSV80_09295 [Acidobacteriota bacterium]
MSAFEEPVCVTGRPSADASRVDASDETSGAVAKKFSALSPREADVLALAVRGLLDRVTVPLARAAATFSDGYGWRESGYAR